MAFVPSACMAQVPSGFEAVRTGPVAFDSSDSFRVTAPNYPNPFRIEVVEIKSPANPPAAGQKVPVVFVTDGNLLLKGIAQIAAGGSIEAVPPMFVVGIGYELDPGLEGREWLLSYYSQRTRDLTPTLDAEFQKEFDAYTTAMVGRKASDLAAPGGADAFLNFINQQLKPFIADRYPSADIDDTALIGHSAGGLFVLHVLFTSPESFTRYAALSPDVSYDDGVIFKEEAKRGDIHARLFMSAGEEEPLFAAVKQMDVQIKAHARPQLNYSFTTFPGEGHSSVVPGASMRALRSLFDPPPRPKPIAAD